MNKRKLLSVFLAGAMLFGSLPAVMAEEEIEPQPPTQEEELEQITKQLKALADEGEPEALEEEPELGAVAPAPTEQPAVIPEQTEPPAALTEAQPLKQLTEPAVGGGTMTQDEYFQQTIDQYADIDLSDPNIITDDAFFGVWDSENGAWTKKPYFDYNSYPGLQYVEEAAQKGDYEAAKDELLTYYREKLKKYDPGIKPINTKRGMLSAQMPFENLIMATNGDYDAIEKLTLTSQPQTFEIDVLQDVQGTLGRTQKKMTYSLIALKKDGYMGVFDSAESADESARPYVKLTVNGSQRRFDPIGDGTVSAKANQNTKYGSKPDLLVEESVSSVNTTATVDQYTKRGYLMFDFSSLNPSDKVTSATLYLHGRMEQSDNPIPPPERKNATDVIVWISEMYDWTNENLCWAALSHEVFSTDGEGGPNYKPKTDAGKVSPSLVDNEIKYSYFLYNLVAAYLYRNEEAYAYHAIRLIMNSIRTMGANQLQAQYSKAHNCGQRAKFLAMEMPVLIQSEYMTPDVFAAFMKNVYNIAHALTNYWTSQEEGNNFGSLQIEGLFNLSVCYPEFVEYWEPLVGGSENPHLMNSSLPGSVHGGWLATVKYRMTYKVKQDLFPDGSCIEVPLGYTDLNVGTYISAMDNMDKAGMVPSDVFSDEEIEMLIKYGHLLLSLSTPTFGDWQQGHGYTHLSNYSKRAKQLDKYVDDPMIKWAATGGEEGTPPDYDSIVYNIGMKAVLRTAWNANAVAMQINADGGQKSHGQHDDLGLNYYAYGQHFLVDGLYDDYTASKSTNLFLNSTRAHNTIEINGVSQKGAQPASGNDPFGNAIRNPGAKSSSASGKVTEMMGSMHPENQELNSMYDFLRAETKTYTDNDYDGAGDFMEYRDILFVKPGYTIVTDYIKPTNSQQNTYVQNWHLIPGAKEQFDASTGKLVTKMDDANMQLIPVVQGTPFTASVRKGLYASKAGAVDQREYYALEKKAKGAASFNTLIYPTKRGENKTVSTQNIKLDVDEATANAFSINVLDNASGGVQKAAYYTLFDQSKKALRTFGDYASDGDVAFVEKNGSTLTTAILRGGKRLEDHTAKFPVLMTTGDAIADLGVTWQGGKLELTSSKLMPETMNSVLENLSVYSAVKVNTVRVNETQVAFKQKGTCVYFGSAPGWDDNTTVPEPPSGGGSGGSANPDGSHGGSGSSGTVIPPVVTPPGGTESGIPESMKQELENHWGKAEITDMLEKGIVKGVSDASLGLDNTTTRAEFVTMLVRALELETVGYDGGFTDVAQGDWYAEAIATAAANGLLEGSDGAADPDAKITREQMAKILVKAYELKKAESVKGAESGFSDDGEISEWAREYVGKAVALGLMKGMEDGSFAPGDSAKRDQAIVVVARLLNLEQK